MFCQCLIFIPPTQQLVVSSWLSFFTKRHRNYKFLQSILNQQKIAKKYISIFIQNLPFQIPLIAEPTTQKTINQYKDNINWSKYWLWPNIFFHYITNLYDKICLSQLNIKMHFCKAKTRVYINCLQNLLVIREK